VELRLRHSFSQSLALSAPPNGNVRSVASIWAWRLTKKARCTIGKNTDVHQCGIFAAEHGYDLVDDTGMLRIVRRLGALFHRV
jgi:hypothetical protein